MLLLEVLGPIGVLLIIVLARSIRVVQQYEQGVVSRFGKVLPEIRGPGLAWIWPVGYRLQKVNMQIVTMTLPANKGITRDNIGVEADAAVFFRVVDPIKAVCNVQDYLSAVSQQAQASLRSIVGQSEMDKLLAERDMLNIRIRESIGAAIEGPMGIRVERVEIKDVSLSGSSQQSPARLDTAAANMTASNPAVQPPFPPNTMTGDDRQIWSIA
jgi:regulator of protease activity HflC (stomatin/prohibitin superfamily)